MGAGRRRRGGRLHHLADRRAVLGAFAAFDSAPRARPAAFEGFARRSGVPALARRRAGASRRCAVAAVPHPRLDAAARHAAAAGGGRAVGAADRQRSRLGARHVRHGTARRSWSRRAGSAISMRWRSAAPAIRQRASTPTRPCATACWKRRAKISRSMPAGASRHERGVAEARAWHRRDPARARPA